MIRRRATPRLADPAQEAYDPHFAADAPQGRFTLDTKLYFDIISGRRRGLFAAAARALLWCAAWPYGIAVWWINRRFDRDPRAVRRAGAPVVSVGNLTVGGTGKTPMVKFIARFLRERGVRVAILSRGYGAEAGQKNDEALELEHALPDVPHLQNPDRVASARAALEELASQALLLDDGFQHRRLARDLDIVLLDATNPFGFGHLLPRGVLREPLGSLRRAQVVCLTRSDAISPADRQDLWRRIASVAPDAARCEAAHSPDHLLNSEGGKQAIDELAGKRVAAFCGIGNPGAFRGTLEAAGAEVVAFLAKPDHHAYTAQNIAQLERLASESEADCVVCTHKDLVKVRLASLAGVPVWALVIEMRLVSGREQLEENLIERIARAALEPSEE